MDNIEWQNLFRPIVDAIDRLTDEVKLHNNSMRNLTAEIVCLNGIQFELLKHLRDLPK